MFRTLFQNVLFSLAPRHEVAVHAYISTSDYFRHVASSGVFWPKAFARWWDSSLGVGANAKDKTTGCGFFRRLGSRILRGCQREMRYFSRMLNERFLWVTTTLPSRASQPIAHSKMGPFPSASFLSCASERSPWVLRACQIAPATWPISSSMVFPILHYLTSKMSGGACYAEKKARRKPEKQKTWVAQ